MLIGDLGRLLELEKRLLGGQMAAPAAPAAPTGRLVDPQGAPVSSRTLEERSQGLWRYLDTPKIAHQRTITRRTYVVDPIIPTGKSTLLVGDSGIGKTPFLYQLGLCVAGGRTFLNMPVKQGPVLYIDAETSLEHSTEYQKKLTTYLGFPPEAELPFYISGRWHGLGQDEVLTKVEGFVALVRPVLVMFDCVRVLWENAEKDNAQARAMWKFHEHLQGKFGCATVAVHHLRKPPLDPKTGRELGAKLQLEPREWLRNSAGTGALLNTCESRVGVALYKGRSDRNKTIVLGGFAKSDGDYEPLVAERVPGDDGKPVGYVVNVEALREQLPEEMRQLLEALPEAFRNKDAVRLGATMSMSETKVNNTLPKLMAAQRVMKEEDGSYRKL
jgi:hypothetical protein